MLPRALLKVSLMVLPMLLAVMVVIRAQPVDDRALQALLVPETCAMPCFLGIHPGVTSVRDALHLLGNHAWVAAVEPHYIAVGTHLRGWVYWDWNASAPAWFQSVHDVMRGHDGMFELVDNVVEDVTIATHIPFGRLRLAMGKPDGFALSFSDVIVSQGRLVSANLRYQDAYLGGIMQAETITSCQAARSLWSQNSVITFFASSQITQQALRFSSSNPFLAEVKALQQKVCPGFR